MAFKASPSSQHQHCTDEAQKAETVLSAVIYIYIYIYIYIATVTKSTATRITTSDLSQENALHKMKTLTTLKLTYTT